MEKESAYPTPRGQPDSPPMGNPPSAGTPSYDTPVPKPPNMWDAFKGGLESINTYRKPGLAAQEWADYRLTRQQWLAKYPDKNWQDHSNWHSSVQKRRKQQRTNWFQRAIYPLHRFIPRR